MQKMSVIQRVFTVTSPAKSVSAADILYAILQVGVSSGIIYIVLGQISNWASSGNLSAGTAAVVAAVVIGIKSGLQAYFGGPIKPEPTQAVVPPPFTPPVLVVGQYPVKH